MSDLMEGYSLELWQNSHAPGVPASSHKTHVLSMPGALFLKKRKKNTHYCTAVITYIICSLDIKITNTDVLCHTCYGTRKHK